MAPKKYFSLKHTKLLDSVSSQMIEAWPILSNYRYSFRVRSNYQNLLEVNSRCSSSPKISFLKSRQCSIPT
jgi:hypothetical protein